MQLQTDHALLPSGQTQDIRERRWWYRQLASCWSCSRDAEMRAVVFRMSTDLHAPGTSLMWRLQKESSVAALWMRRTLRGADLCLEVDGRRQFTMSASLEDVGLQSLRLRHRLEEVGWQEPQGGG